MSRKIVISNPGSKEKVRQVSEYDVLDFLGKGIERLAGEVGDVGFSPAEMAVIGAVCARLSCRVSNEFFEQEDDKRLMPLKDMIELCLGMIEYGSKNETQRVN